MNYELGGELLQQPLLSSPIIPDVTDDELLIKKMMKSEMKIEKPVVKSPAYKIIQQNGSSYVQIKNNATDATPKVQFVKKIPTNLVQIAGARSPAAKQNQTVINDNAVGTPVVINKVNGNISGKYYYKVYSLHLDQAMITLSRLKVFVKWFKWRKDPIRSPSFCHSRLRMARTFAQSKSSSRRRWLSRRRS